MSALRTLRKLVLGETWTVPIAVAAAIGLAALVRALAGGWWRSDGGFVLLALILAGYFAATWAQRPAPSARREPAVAPPPEAQLVGETLD